MRCENSQPYCPVNDDTDIGDGHSIHFTSKWLSMVGGGYQLLVMNASRNAPKWPAPKMSSAEDVLHTAFS